VALPKKVGEINAPTFFGIVALFGKCLTYRQAFLFIDVKSMETRPYNQRNTRTGTASKRTIDGSSGFMSDGNNKIC
jgi:hypothetical protein